MLELFFLQHQHRFYRQNVLIESFHLNGDTFSFVWQFWIEVSGLYSNANEKVKMLTKENNRFPRFYGFCNKINEKQFS